MMFAVEVVVCLLVTLLKEQPLPLAGSNEQFHLDKHTAILRTGFRISNLVEHEPKIGKSLPEFASEQSDSEEEVEQTLEARKAASAAATAAAVAVEKRATFSA